MGTRPVRASVRHPHRDGFQFSLSISIENLKFIFTFSSFAFCVWFVAVAFNIFNSCSISFLLNLKNNI